jgi:hypothetical protein
VDPDTVRAEAGNDHPLGDSADGRYPADEREARSTPPDARTSDDAHGALFHDPGPQARDDGPFDDAGASGAVRRGEAGGTEEGEGSQEREKVLWAMAQRASLRDQTSLAVEKRRSNRTVYLLRKGARAA